MPTHSHLANDDRIQLASSCLTPFGQCSGFCRECDGVVNTGRMPRNISATYDRTKGGICQAGKC